MRDAIAVLDQATDLSLVAVTERSLAAWRLLLERSGQRAGCAVLAVAVDTDSPELRNRTAAAFRAWRLRLAEMLVTGGLESAPAARWAATLVAAAEGAVVLARAERSMEPFDLVEELLLDSAGRLGVQPGPGRH